VPKPRIFKEGIMRRRQYPPEQLIGYLRGAEILLAKETRLARSVDR